MTTPIHHNIAQAQAAAEAVTPSRGQIVPFSRPLSLTDNLAGSFAVDTWLKVKPYGMTIGKDTTTLFDRLVFRIDMSTVVYCRRVRYGNPAEYRTTYDGVHDFRGGLWADTVAQARSIDPKCQGDYRSADIPLIAAEDIVAKDGTVLAEQGGKIGYAPAITGWHGWADLIRRLVTSGIDPEEALIAVTTRVQYNKNASGEWGTVAFESFEAVA
jgi:hypothetical protein